MRQRHSSEFKESIVQKSTMPDGPTIMQLSEKTGIHHTSIRNWIKIYANNFSMKKSKEWSPESKLEAIIKTATMSENELGEFLRANGLHSTEIEEAIANGSRHDIACNDVGIDIKTHKRWKWILKINEKGL